MLPDAASLAVPIVLREKGTSGPLPCPATPAPSCRLAHQWLEGCWTPRLKVDLGACVALSPLRVQALAPSRRVSQPTNRTATAPSNAPRRQLTWEARLGTETPDPPSFQLFSRSFLALEAPGARVRYAITSPGVSSISALLTFLRLQSEKTRPDPWAQAWQASAQQGSLLSLSLSPVSIPNSTPGNLGIHTVYREPGDPPAATLFTLFSSASWLSLASPPRAPSRANSTPLFDLVTSFSSLHFPHPD